MERQKERLVEGIFSRLKRDKDQPRKIPSLFQLSQLPAAPPLAARPSVSTPSGQRFPIGLHMEASSLKWVQLGLVGGKVQVVDLGIQEIREPAGGQRELSGLVGQRRLTGEVVLSLPLEDVILRLLSMPVLPEQEMEQAVRWHIEQTLPSGVSSEEFTFDYTVLKEIVPEWEPHVLVASVPNKRVVEKAGQALEAGLKPIAVEIEPFALAAGLAWARPSRFGETVLLVHLGSSTASLSVLVNGQPVFAQPLLTTDRVLTQNVMDHLRVSWQEADGLKRTHGLLATAADPGVAVARALASPLENLAVDLLHAFSSFSHRMTQSKIQRFDRLLLSGAGAQLPGLMQWFQARLQVSVEGVHLLEAMRLSEALRSDRSWSVLGPQFSIAAGLALRGVPESHSI